MEIRIHSAPALQPEDVASTEGIPTTSVARTLLDFAAVDPWFIGKAVENAYRLGLLDLAAIDNLLSRSKGFRGVARLSEALIVYRIPGFTRSDFERFFLAMSRSEKLPQPSMNFVAAGYELDAYWPAQRFAVELDTYEYHELPTEFILIGAYGLLTTNSALGSCATDPARVALIARRGQQTEEETCRMSTPPGPPMRPLAAATWKP